MTDEELLKLAAKASKEYGEWVFGEYRQGRIINGLWQDLLEVCWNPLTDDGDALRLAVELQISISMNIIRVEASTIKLVLDRVNIHEDTIRQDSFAATRRAIVRAAAEIGRTK